MNKNAAGYSLNANGSRRIDPSDDSERVEGYMPISRLDEALRLVKTLAQLHHRCGPHAPNFVTFAECKDASCVSARELLEGEGIEL